MSLCATRSRSASAPEYHPASPGRWPRTPSPATTYHAANQQLTFGDVTQTFDANGNLLTQADASGTITYTWNARNRLTGMSGPSISVSFAYDALGRRAVKTINGQDTSFQYDGLDIVQESGGPGLCRTSGAWQLMKLS